MQARTVRLRRKIIDAITAIAARGEYPSVRRVCRELGCPEGARPGNVCKIRAALIAEGVVAMEIRRGGEQAWFRRPVIRVHGTAASPL